MRVSRSIRKQMNQLVVSTFAWIKNMTQFLIFKVSSINRASFHLKLKVEKLNLFEMSHSMNAL
jgi:hypothetical protein